MDMNQLLTILPNNVRHRVEPYFDAVEVLTAVKDPRVMASLGPSGVRGLLLQRGKQGVPTLIQATHSAFFDWTYPSDQPEMQDLYRRAKLGQWNGDRGCSASFLHGEQGALLAAAQVTEAVQFFDGKLYGSTQVMDEAATSRSSTATSSEKLNKLYPINDNLFVIIDALMADSRWDMKFLGMQIMVEGLALGAFGTLYSNTASRCSSSC
jgi:hypothetical protein